MKMRAITFNLLLACSLLVVTALPGRAQMGAAKGSNSPHRMLPRGSRSMNGMLWMQSHYCGGAAPSPEMEAAARRPAPAIGTWVYVRKGKWNNLRKPLVDSCQVDTAGRFSFGLPKGNYVVLLPAQRDSSIAMRSRKAVSGLHISDEACYRAWIRKGWLQVNLRKEDAFLDKFILRKDCFLPLGMECASYDGPFPP